VKQPSIIFYLIGLRQYSETLQVKIVVEL